MALPDYSGGGFYDPTRGYTGSTTGSFRFPQGGLAQQIYGTDTAPQAAYQTKLQQLGLGGFGSRAKKAQSLYGESNLAYQQALMNDDLNMFYPEWLDQANVGEAFNNLSYEAQGLNPNRFGQGRYRWGQRSG